jgi:site-specific DNA-cytosine methylase
VYGSELMTGIANGALEISKLTVRALRDLGYTTDLGKADPYMIPQRRRLSNNVANDDDKVRFEDDLLKIRITQLTGKAKPGRKRDHRKEVERYQQQKRRAHAKQGWVHNKFKSERNSTI